ncbi:MerR family transcriptional regulator [Nocardiopsis sp. HNM0947]|uniref:MerR family transcriptional regulator n=1 Tax=Nocardiopsis coralli TaxID=2772213 RepID=A0ABR9PCG0_9ACTN|nr:MerR family transcriptional regulator [Nocardiopsis coralli]MBE3001531.1 MerR family transcriptional regulator [Nocardiopsis coralli]
MVLMRVSDLAERSGVPATTLRYYEERGLLPAQRSPGGYRLYDERSLDRLVFITTAKRLGLALDDIAELTALWSAHPCSRVRSALGPRLEHRLAEARARAAEVEDFQALLRAALERLQRLPDRDAPCDPGCEFLTAMAPGARAAEPRASGPTDPTAPASGTRAALPLLDGPGPRCLLAEHDHRERMDRWRELLGEATRTPREHGCSWDLPLERAGAVADLAAAEQQCCSFLDLRIDFTPRRVHLHVRVHPGHRPDTCTPAGQAARLLGALDHTVET